VFNNLTHHVNAGRAEAARYMAAVRMERENELFDQNNRLVVQDFHRRRAAADQQRRAAAAEDQRLRAEFQRHSRSIEPYVPQPLPGFVNPLAEFGIPLRTQANTQFNTNGVNPR
jgi:hypothetical protein